MSNLNIKFKDYASYARKEGICEITAKKRIKEKLKKREIFKIYDIKERFVGYVEVKDILKMLTEYVNNEDEQES